MTDIPAHYLPIACGLCAALGFALGGIANVLITRRSHRRPRLGTIDLRRDGK